jgi:hypothetical protein
MKSIRKIYGVGRSDNGLLRLATVIGTIDAKQMQHKVNTWLSMRAVQKVTSIYFRQLM